MVNGKFIVAQEIIVQLSSDLTSAPKDLPAIGNLDKVIIDNEGKYMGNSNTNSFKVSEDGGLSSDYELSIINNKRWISCYWSLG